MFFEKLVFTGFLKKFSDLFFDTKKTQLSQLEN